MKTGVYVKMDAPRIYYYLRGVCRQLGFLTYHLEVQLLKVRRAEKADDTRENKEQQAVCQVPILRIRLEVELDNGNQEFKNRYSVLIESDKILREQGRVHMEDGLLQFNDQGTAVLSVVNHLGLTQKLEKGKKLGVVVSAEMLDSTMTGNIARCLAVTQELEDDRVNDREELVKMVDTDHSTVRLPFTTHQDGRMQRLR